MTTARTATRKPAPRPAAEKTAEAVELTVGERLAADLRVLADLAASTPPVAEDLAAALSEVTVVLRVNGGAVDVLAAALAEQKAAEQPSVDDPTDPFFAGSSWLLPNRAITLSALVLDVSVDDIEAAGR